MIAQYLISLSPVMRACEGCRRRKIKCDAATTNTWPCSACVRLKLTCVPPTASYEREESNGGQEFDMSNNTTFDVLEPGANETYPDQASLAATLAEPLPAVPLGSSSPDGFNHFDMYQSSSYLDRPLDPNSLDYGKLSSTGTSLPTMGSTLQNHYSHSSASAMSEPDMSLSSDPNVSGLADALNELQIVYTGVRM